MIIIGILLNIVGLGVFCWVLFTLAIYALPFFVGMTAGDLCVIKPEQVRSAPSSLASSRAASHSWSGSTLFSVARSPIVRLVIALLFAVPAARAGYDVTLGLAAHRHSLGMVAGVVRRDRRDRRRVHRLGARGDADRPLLSGRALCSSALSAT